MVDLKGEWWMVDKGRWWMVDLKGGWWMVDKGRWWMVDLKDVPHARHSEEVGGYLEEAFSTSSPHAGWGES